MVSSERHIETELDAETLTCTARSHCTVSGYRMERYGMAGKTVALCFVGAIAEKFTAGTQHEIGHRAVTEKCSVAGWRGFAVCRTGG